MTPVVFSEQGALAEDRVALGRVLVVLFVAFDEVNVAHSGTGVYLVPKTDFLLAILEFVPVAIGSFLLLYHNITARLEFD